MRVLLFAVVAAFFVLLAACTNRSKLDPMLEGLEQKKIASITVDELEQQLAAGASRPVDANGPGTRQKLGVIPGAVLLSDYEGFQPSELGDDKGKGLVFYCANQQCSASHEAAERAVAAGYMNVKILPAGIAGWRKAGKPTQQVAAERTGS